MALWWSWSLFLELCLILLLPGVSCWDCTDPGDRTNIMCFEPGSCGPEKVLLNSGVFPYSEQVATLHFHNRMRRLVATGKMHMHPAASNLYQVEWSDKVAKAAARYASLCQDPEALPAAKKYGDELNEHYYVNEYLQENNTRPYYMSLTNSIFEAVCGQKFDISNKEDVIKLDARFFAWAHLVQENFTTLGCGYSQFTSMKDMQQGNFNVYTFKVCLYGRELYPEGKFYHTGKLTCDVHSQLYPGLCSTPATNKRTHDDPCDDAYFASQHKLLCRYMNPLWFCEVNNLRMLGEELRPNPKNNTELSPDPEPEPSGSSVLPWVVLGVTVPVTAGGGVAAYLYWDEIMEMVGDLMG